MSTQQKQGFLYLTIAVLGWASAPVFVHYFSTSFDSWTQNFFRYATGTVLLWIVSLLFARNDLKKVLHQPKLLLLPIVANILLQVCWVKGLYYIQPAFGLLVVKVSVLFSAVLAYIVYQDERRLIRDPRYIIGTIISFAGFALLVLSGRVNSPLYLRGVVLLVFTAMFSSIYALSVKRLVRQVTPVAAYTVIASGTTIALCIGMLWRGNPQAFFDAPSKLKLLIVLSGVVCLVIAHVSYYNGIRLVGVAASASFTLIQPLFTATLSYMVFGELLSPVHIVAGIILVAGSYLVIHTSNTT